MAELVRGVRHAIVWSLAAAVGAGLPLAVAAPAAEPPACVPAWAGSPATAVGAGLALLGAGAASVFVWRRRRAAADQRATPADLQAAIAALADGVLMRDANDRVRVWNERCLDLFPCLRPVIAIGAPWPDLAAAAACHSLPDADAAQRQAWVAERLRRGPGPCWQHDLTLPDGRCVQVVERELPDGSVVSSFRDVTAAERRLRDASLRADAAEAARARMLSSVSHELRTPLHALLGLADMLQRSVTLEQERQWCRLLQGHSRVLQAWVNHSLDLACIDAGRMALEPAAFDVRQLLAEAAAPFMERQPMSAVDFAWHVAPEVPPSLVGDASRLQQVLLVLLGNAFKFTHHGRVLLAADAHPLPQGDAATPRVLLHLHVSDTGIGIPAAALPRLFERFERAGTTPGLGHGGTGLGLAIVRELVQRMGGEVSVHSVPGEGSTFDVQLPLPLPLPAAAAPTAPEGGPPAEARALTLLVAEDNPVNRMIMAAVLRGLGHRFEIVDDGCAALARLQGGQRYDAVLMDVQMPMMDGLAATLAIRALPSPARHVPIIAVTANTFDSDRAACLAAGMNAVVGKPFTAATLQRAIAAATVRP